MSGRLTILPKKTYCPWKPENVERVLRDERLERERLEREAKQSSDALKDQRRRRRRKAAGEDDGGEDEETSKERTISEENGHINLFPEAREEELRLVGQKSKPSTSNQNVNDGGVAPVPLGGDEATKRKLGSVPFYMRHNSQENVEGGKYHDNGSSFRLGRAKNVGNGGRATATTSDEITTRIMNDQYEKREDGRKDKMDPMSRFFVGTAGFSTKEVSSKSRMGTKNCNVRTTDENERTSSFMSKKHSKTTIDKNRHRKRYHKRKSHRTSQDEDGYSSTDSHSESSSCSSSSSSSSGQDRYDSKRRRKRRRHSSKKEKNKKHGRSERRHHHQSSSNLSRRRSRHRSDSSDKKESHQHKQSAMDEELEQLRRRRRKREAKELERQIAITGNGAKGNISSGISSGRYQDQFHPSLSRN